MAQEKSGKFSWTYDMHGLPCIARRFLWQSEAPWLVEVLIKTGWKVFMTIKPTITNSDSVDEALVTCLCSFPATFLPPILGTTCSIILLHARCRKTTCIKQILILLKF